MPQDTGTVTMSVAALDQPLGSNNFGIFYTVVPITFNFIPVAEVVPEPEPEVAEETTGSTDESAATAVEEEEAVVEE